MQNIDSNRFRPPATRSDPTPFQAKETEPRADVEAAKPKYNPMLRPARAAKGHMQLNETALEGIENARKVAERNGLDIRLREGKNAKLHFVFAQQLGKSRLTVASWYPSTGLLAVGTIRKRAATITETTIAVIEALTIGNTGKPPETAVAPKRTTKPKSKAKPKSRPAPETAEPQETYGMLFEFFPGVVAELG